MRSRMGAMSPRVASTTDRSVVSSRAVAASASSCSAASTQPRRAGMARSASEAPAAVRMAAAASTRSQPRSNSSLSAARVSARMASAWCVRDPLAMRSSLQVGWIDPPSGRRMGWPSRRYAVVTASPTHSAPGTVFIMADPRHTAAPAEPSVGTPEGAVLLTQADFDALIRELEALRSKHRGELAGRLREARAFGTSSENDDLLAAFEESAVDHARLAKLEELLRLAVVVESSAGDGGAGLGSTVRVADDKGRTTEYDLK